MGDFGKRGKFFQKKVTDTHFMNVAKKIREEIFSDSKTLFLDPDLKKRSRAFNDLKNLKNKYQMTFDGLSIDRKKKLITAIDLDDRKIDNALRDAKVVPYLDTCIGHVPLLNELTGEYFTLLDYLQDKDYLSSKMVTFEIHLHEYSVGMLLELLPGINDPELLEALEGSSSSHKHLIFSTDNIQYDLIKNQHTGLHIVGKCQLKNLSHQVKYEIPQNHVPGDINWEIDRILREKP